jgi:hypothetical protein
MQIKLRKEQQSSSGSWKQWLELKCWHCPTVFTPWKKNIFSKQKKIFNPLTNKKQKTKDN